MAFPAEALPCERSEGGAGEGLSSAPVTPLLERPNKQPTLTCLSNYLYRAPVMSEVLPRVNRACEEITMAVYRMQSLQHLSRPGEERCKYYIHNPCLSEVDPPPPTPFCLCIPQDLSVLPRICKGSPVAQLVYFLPSPTPRLTGCCVCLPRGHPHNTRLLAPLTG